MGPIGVFDSGYGGLTVLRCLQNRLAHADFLYLGDNARAPYGNRSYDLVYEFTRQAVMYLFDAGCPLVILACNTASAKALRSIQQRDLPKLEDKGKRVLGVIRPTAEAIAASTRTGAVGLLGTPGTVASGSYDMEVAKAAPQVRLNSHACPMWVPLIENFEADGDGADYFVKKDLTALFSQAPDIDTLILGCTHYPLLINKIEKYIPAGVNILSQGALTAASLEDYLKRHPEMAGRITQGGHTEYLTTEKPEKFDAAARLFLRVATRSQRVVL